MPNQPTITWTVSADQASLIISTLQTGTNALIALLQEQATPQIQAWQQEQQEAANQPAPKANGDGRHMAAS